MGKIKVSRNSDRDHKKKNNLATDILDDRHAVSKRSKKSSKPEVVDANSDEYVEEKLSKQILSEARKQQKELEEEYGISSVSSGATQQTTSLGTQGVDSDSDDDAPSEDEDYMDYLAEDVKDEDEAALAKFMCPKSDRSTSLIETLKEKITEKQSEIASQMSEDSRLSQPDLDERVIEMYKSIKEILTKYRSGKLPKAFKVIPALRNWEQVLYLTGPDTWSAAAVYQAARLFSSNLKAKMAQRFYNLVLLPRMRDDINEYKRLNYHIYQALKRSLFKPAAFFKGILLPLCESGTCTLREAIILSSIIAKNSIPMLHSAAAMLKIAEMQYNGANSIFLRTLIDKKYALPYRVIDALVFHFLQFEHDKREMPVLWHQSLLAFAQRYKEDISSEQKSALINLLRHQQHPKITPEIRREFVESKCRDEETAIPIDTD